MLKLLARLWLGAFGARPGSRTRPDFDATQLADSQHQTQLMVSWPARALEIQARSHDRGRAAAILARLLADDGQSALGAERERRLLASYLDFAEVDAGARIIGQDEQGDYLMIVLEGAVAVDRAQPSGATARLGEARSGDVLGELSLLDPDARFCSCITLTPSVVAVLKAQSLEWMIRAEPRLAALLLSWIGKRLSARLRQVSARLSTTLTRP